MPHFGQGPMENLGIFKASHKVPAACLWASGEAPASLVHCTQAMGSGTTLLQKMVIAGE